MTATRSRPGVKRPGPPLRARQRAGAPRIDSRSESIRVAALLAPIVTAAADTRHEDVGRQRGPAVKLMADRLSIGSWRGPSEPTAGLDATGGARPVRPGVGVRRCPAPAGPVG